MNKHLAEEVVAALLIEEAVGCLPEADGQWPTFIGSIPTDADKDLDEAQVLIGEEDVTEGRIHRTGEVQGFEQFQYYVRGKTFVETREQLTAVMAVFDSVGVSLPYELNVEDKYYRVWGIHRLTSPVWMGPDANNRPVFTLNCRLKVTEV